MRVCKFPLARCPCRCSCRSRRGRSFRSPALPFRVSTWVLSLCVVHHTHTHTHERCTMHDAMSLRFAFLFPQKANLAQTNIKTLLAPTVVSCCSDCCKCLSVPIHPHTDKQTYQQSKMAHKLRVSKMFSCAAYSPAAVRSDMTESVKRNSAVKYRVSETKRLSGEPEPAVTTPMCLFVCGLWASDRQTLARVTTESTTTINQDRSTCHHLPPAPPHQRH